MVLFFGFGFAQKSEDFNFIKDTVRITKENKVIDAEYIITTFKTGTTIQLIKGLNNKLYMRIVTSENNYFGKTDVLEVKSGSKSYFAKETINIQLDKNYGYYVIEIFKNYIATLKDDGITGFSFAKAVTSFTKQDCNQVKQMAKYFYETVCAKK